MSVHLFGIRHHGPGCARSLRSALEALAPDVVLVEGPPDAEPVLPLLGHAAMQPPVALLIYRPEAPQRAVFYPFAAFSPEWQALRYAHERGIPARFMDLPQAIQLARAPGEEAADEQESQPEAATAVSTEQTAVLATPTLREDPLGALAEAAGYIDRELWWEQQIEQRVDATGLFEGILEAMTALRAEASALLEERTGSKERAEEAQREAHMRQSIRAAQREGFARIAVVCGAWHAPALAHTAAEVADAERDTALLADLPRTAVAATWIPWTSSRLASRSGYGAGVACPGWYSHLWAAPDRAGVRWAVQVAQLLRGEDLDTSSASVIEAVRLSETLAALRGLPMAGLAELDEAVLAVLCHGDTAPMRLIRKRLTIGEVMGQVPPETPGVPLQQDLERQQHRLKLPPSPAATTKDLDLRMETDRARSQLLHRLRLLGIPWGQPQRASGKLGTFHELWHLEWQPEYSVRLIEASMHGNTVRAAATGFARHTAERAPDLPHLTELLDAVVLAELPEAVAFLLRRVQLQAAVAADVRHLMGALPPLAHIARYGNVRGMRPEQVMPLVEGLVARITVGLPGACASLDAAAAEEMIACIGHVQQSLMWLDRADLRVLWQAALRPLAEHDTVHGLVRGRCCRLLVEDQVLDDVALQRLARLALAAVVPAEQAAAWVEGLVRGTGLSLLHQHGVWAALDGWLRALTPEVFVAVLPLLRRAFAGFAPAERRAMGETLKRLQGGVAAPKTIGIVGPASGSNDMARLDRARADRVLPVLAQVLGVRRDDK